MRRNSIFFLSPLAAALTKPNSDGCVYCAGGVKDTKANSGSAARDDPRQLFTDSS